MNDKARKMLDQQEIDLGNELCNYDNVKSTILEKGKYECQKEAKTQ